MKIQFTKQHTDPFGKTYLPGWVADWSQPDGERAIAEGFAIHAPEGAYPRKQAAPVLECATPAPLPLSGDMEATGQEIDLDELKAEKPQVVPKTARFKL